MTAGIYAIIFEGLDSFYIGKSDNILRRNREHLNLLKKGHYNYKLANAYIKYGTPYFYTLEECSIENLNSREIFWIEEFKSNTLGLNITKGGDGGSMGFDHPKSVYSEKQLISSFKYLSTGTLSYAKICALTGVKISTLTGIASGRCHSWLIERFPVEYPIMLNDKANRASRILFKR